MVCFDSYVHLYLNLNVFLNCLFAIFQINRSGISSIVVHVRRLQLLFYLFFLRNVIVSTFPREPQRFVKNKQVGKKSNFAASHNLTLTAQKQLLHVKSSPVSTFLYYPMPTLELVSSFRLYNLLFFSLIFSFSILLIFQTIINPSNALFLCFSILSSSDPLFLSLMQFNSIMFLFISISFRLSAQTAKQSFLDRKGNFFPCHMTFCFCCFYAVFVSHWPR